MARTRPAFGLALVALLPAPAPGGPPDVHRRDLLGKEPPELAARDADWLGGAPPTRLAALRGRVVWLQFNF